MGYRPESTFGLAKPTHPLTVNAYGQVKKAKAVSVVGMLPERGSKSPAERKIMLWAWRRILDPTGRTERMVVERFQKACSTRRVAEEMAAELSKPEHGWTVTYDVSKPPKSYKHLLVPKK